MSEKHDPVPRKRKRRVHGTYLIKPEEMRRVEVCADFAGVRLDIFLSKKLKWRSRAGVQKLLDERDVRIGGIRRKASYRVREGEIVEIPLPPPPPEAFRIHEIPLNIIHEDEYLVVLNKQPGVIVHPTGRKRYETLINALHMRYRRPDDPERDIIPRLAHRLDKDTSGVLVVCKTAAAHRDLYFQFERGRVEKEYLAIIEGEPEKDRFRIDLPLGQDKEAEIRLKQGVRRDDGLAAVTDVMVRRRFGRYSLVACNPKTGKQHQIRVHLAAVGHPIVADRLYGHGKRLTLAAIVGETAQDEILLDRQALHAHRLQLRHPVTGERMIFIAPPPDDFVRALEVLERHRNAD